MKSPDNHLFAEYSYLRDLLSHKQSASLHELSLCNKEHTNIPPPSLLFCFSSLRSLILSHNLINRFSADDLLRGAPLLEKLDISYNNIATLDDLVELGSSKSLRSLNIIGNPISSQYARIQVMEQLLFPKKYRSYNPVEILTATYNLSAININDEKEKRKCGIFVNRVPGSSKSKRGQFIREESDEKGAKLLQEMCPIPRKTRFPYLGILNDEIISIRDIQNILVSKDISSILFDNKVHNGPTLVRSEKLHQRYIESYIRRKARGKEQIDVIPSLERLSQMIRNNDNMELIQHQDRIRYDKLKLKKPDYEEELWKGPTDSRLQGFDFTVNIAQLKKEAKEYDEKKEAELAYKKDHPKAVKERDRPNQDKEGSNKKKVWKRKKGNGEIGSTNSLESSIPEQQSDLVKKTLGFTEEESSEDSEERSKSKELEEVEPEEEEVLIVPEKVERVALRNRSQSLPKFNKSTNKSKQVAFDNERTSQEGDASIVGNTITLNKMRRTNSEVIGTLSSNVLSFSMTAEELRMKTSVRKISEEPPPVNKSESRNVKRFVVVQDSAPNVGLPLFVQNRPKHKRSASVQPATIRLNLQSRRESISEDKVPIFEAPVPVDIRQVSSLNLQDKDRKGYNHQSNNISNSANLGFPFIEVSKIRDEPSDYPFLSSHQFISMRSDLDLEHREKVESENKSNKKDSIIDSSKFSFITPANSSRYRSNSPSPYEIASSVVTSMLNSGVQVKRPVLTQDAIIASVISAPKKLPEFSPYDKNSFRVEERGGSSRPETAKSAADLYSEIHNSLVHKKVASTKQVINRKDNVRKNIEEKGGTLKISNVLGCFNSERGNRGQSKSPGVRNVRKNRVQELATLSPHTHTSFLSSQLSKNNNHSMTYIRKLKAAGNFTSRMGLEIQGEQIEDPISAGKGKIGSKEEFGLDSTKSFSAAGQSGRKLKSRSGSAENIISLSSVVSSGVIDRRIRNIRLKQNL